MNKKLIPSVSNLIDLNKNNEFNLFYLSPRILANQFTNYDNQGILSISEYSKFYRYLNLANDLNIIADIQSGFGNQINTYYAARDLCSSGASIILLNDQDYPAQSIDPYNFVSEENLLGKLYAIKKNEKDFEFDIWLKLDGINDYGIDNLIRRIKIAEKIGVKQFLVGNLNHKSIEKLNNKIDLSKIIIFQDNAQVENSVLDHLNIKGYIDDFQKLANF